MRCAKFGRNLPSGPGEEDFKNFINVFSLFCHFPPWGNSVALHLGGTSHFTAAVAQWVRALAPQAEGWVFESKLRQT